jgi:hypothetical protein
MGRHPPWRSRPNATAGGTEEGYQGDQRDRRDVLEQQHRKAAAADRCRHQVAFVHRLHGDGRRRQRQRQSGGHCRLPRQAEGDEAEREHCAARGHLQGAAAEDGTTHLPQARGVELEADEEEHQHHAKLGEVQDGRDVACTSPRPKWDR